MSTDCMLAAVYHGPDDLRVEAVPIPEIEPGEVLLKVTSASICGTDLRIWHGGHRKYPPGTVRIPGHEVIGEITKLGGNIQGFQEGQQVFVAPNMGCGQCRQCLTGNNNLCMQYQAFGVTIDGAFAEYMRIPSQAIQQGNLIPTISQLNPEMAALIEPFACVLRGQNAVNIQPGDTVLIMGAGPIGIMHMLLAKLRGAGKVMMSELIPDRIEQARRLGADRVVNIHEEDLADTLMSESQGQGADVILVATPSPQAQESAIQLAAIGGRINFFGGLPKGKTMESCDSNLIHYKELIVTGTSACSTRDCRQAASIVNSGRTDLSPLVSAKFPLREAPQAFAAAEDRKMLKIVIEP